MRNFDFIKTVNGITLGFKEIQLFNDKKEYIGISYQTWIKKKDGIFYLRNEVKKFH
jgi:hypothetical protein